MGRKKIDINYNVMNALLQRGATKVACAAILEVSEDTIEKRIREDFDLTFDEYKDSKFEKTKAKLVEKAVDKALKGDNTMLIWVMKNLCGWRDKQPDEVDVIINNNTNNLSDEDLDRLIEEKKKKVLGEE